MYVRAIGVFSQALGQDHPNTQTGIGNFIGCVKKGAAGAVVGASFYPKHFGNDRSGLVKRERDIITRRSMEEFSSWRETFYLLSNPANVAYLQRSILEAQTGTGD